MLLRFTACLLLCCVTYLQAARVVCYWNGKSYWREGTAKVTIEEMKPGLSYCTHLLYGFTAFDDDDYYLEPVDKDLDLDKGKGQYRAVAELKRAFPGLSIMLSVGGNEDKDDEEKYFKVLEEPERRAKLINSVSTTLKQYGFDGIDLAWQFPPQHEKYETTSLSSIWHKLKKTFGAGVDSKATEHRDQFVALVRELKAVLRADGKLLSIALLPHVNSSVYMDVRELMPYVDMVNMWTVDYRTPDRSPEKADFATPIYYEYPRLPFQNVDFTVRYWLEHGADSKKLNLGIATWGRSWKLSTSSGISGVPPLVAEEAGPAGPHTKTKGLLSYYETCVKLVSSTNPNAPAGMIRRVTDPSKRLGTYAFRLPDTRAGESEGLWVSFVEPETAGYLAAYSKAKGLGGVALLDLALDDSRGICDGSKFPITRAAKLNLDGTNVTNPSEYRILGQPTIPLGK